MNKKAQEFNFAFLLLALIGGGVAFFVASRAVDGRVIPVLSGLFSVVAIYFYLILTDS